MFQRVFQFLYGNGHRGDQPGDEEAAQANMTGEIGGTQLEIYKTAKNGTTQDTHNIFELKDVWRKSKMSGESPRVMDAYLHLQTQAMVVII